ncbi:TRAP transporter, 4TM/12TM fusion protein [Puniceibacterium sp. IMCC21224]|jgi:TRAP transporter 4TM/12TM fusion protein|nr:TRAP transporter, 4TM/12TM fusion protein [Puniceibacterium sp. IMCC21224]
MSSMDQTIMTPAERVRRLVVPVLAALLTLAALVQVANVPSMLGYLFYTEQFLAVVLALGLPVVFLGKSRDGNRTIPRILLIASDWIFAALSFGAALYLALRYPELGSAWLAKPVDAMVVAALLLPLVLEALRRTTGWTLVILVMLMLAIGLFGHNLQGTLQTRQVDADRLFLYLIFDANGLLGLTLNVAATIVIAFVFFGALLMRSGGGEFFNDLASSSMGSRRGGAAKVSIIGSMLFGTISGVVVSNIVATGVVTIKLMINSGFSRARAAAIEAVASTGGQIVPPVMGAVAFLMADILQRPYSEIVIAAIVPAFLYYLALFIQVDISAARDGIKPLDRSQLKSLGEVMRKGWPFTLPFAAIILAIFQFNQRAEFAALIGSGLALLVGIYPGYGGHRIRLRQFASALSETGRSLTDILMISAAAGLIIGMLNVSGFGFAMTASLVTLGGESLFALLLIAAVASLILGMGMPTIGVYLLLAVLIAPALVGTGIDPIAAHLFIFYLGMMSMVTPPIGIGAFFAAVIAKAPPMKTSLEAVRLGWTAYIVPFIFVFSPALLLNGDPVEVVIAVVTASLGVYAVSAAFVGWMAGRLSIGIRLLLGCAGAALLIPAAPGDNMTVALNASGFLLLSGLFLTFRARSRHSVNIPANVTSHEE